MAEYLWNLTDLENVKRNGYKVFSCFSCGGGSTMGYKLAGYDVIGNCEIDPRMNKVYLKNHHPKYNYCMGIQEFKRIEHLPKELFELDILDGSPPCSSFSLAGSRESAWGKMKKFKEGQAYQVLDDLFFEFIEVANKLRPKVVVAENVKGMLIGNAKGYINMIIKAFEAIGYDVQLFSLNAAVMGVPQKRERVFFIARRKDLNLPSVVLKFNEPVIRYGEFKDEKYKPMNLQTMLYSRWKKRSKRDNSIGDTVKRTENGKISQFNAMFVKDNKVPNTLTAGNAHIRFDVPGTISNRDIKIIQTFPQDYDFLDQDVQYICGMSVPPLMMKRIAHEIGEQILKNQNGNLNK